MANSVSTAEPPRPCAAQHRRCLPPGRGWRDVEFLLVGTEHAPTHREAGGGCRPSRVRAAAPGPPIAGREDGVSLTGAPGYPRLQDSTAGCRPRLPASLRWQQELFYTRARGAVFLFQSCGGAFRFLWLLPDLWHHFFPVFSLCLRWARFPTVTHPGPLPLALTGRSPHLPPQCAVQVKLELGHRAQVRKKPTVEGFTHDWMVFVRGPEHSNIQHFVEKVVFHLHESFPRPKRVCKDPPYKVEESGYAGFILPIEVYFKNKEEPKKVRFDYDLFLHLEGHPPVNHLRCEKLTFNNPTEEFRRKLLKAGGIMVMSDGVSFSSGQSLHLPSLPGNSLSFSATKKKSSHGPKDPARTLNTNSSSSSSSSNIFSKTHKLTKEHKEKTSKDSKEHKSAFKDPSREHNKSSKESSKKPKENKPLKDEKKVPKMAFKEPKPMSKEPKSENTAILTITCGQQHEKKTPTKRSSVLDSDEPAVKKRKKNGSDSLFKNFSSTPPLILTCSADKKQRKDKSQLRVGKVKIESDALEKKTPTLPPFDDIVDPNDSDMEENTSSKSESEQPSPASSSSSSSFTPSQNSRQQGPLRSIMKDLHSDDNEDESDEADENDNDSELERPVNTRGGSRNCRVSLSDGSDTESSSASSSHHEPAPPLLKTNNNQILEVKNPIKQNKSDKQIKNGDCDKAYLDELVELHRRLMTLRERHVLQQIVNLIEETGHFHITNTTFDFDLCSLDKTTVRKLQSYLETSGTS
ncbi:protein AF-9 [Indicator indicator]|uniref:protein AF-9 n=1 Tax=Indicator indicator TaxID=1002788 RepID=UPI0023E04517|nr:protein AF-9 [Indicator indicator]